MGPALALGSVTMPIAVVTESGDVEILDLPREASGPSYGASVRIYAGGPVAAQAKAFLCARLLLAAMAHPGGLGAALRALAAPYAAPKWDMAEAGDPEGKEMLRRVGWEPYGVEGGVTHFKRIGGQVGEEDAF